MAENPGFVPPLPRFRRARSVARGTRRGPSSAGPARGPSSRRPPRPWLAEDMTPCWPAPAGCLPPRHEFGPARVATATGVLEIVPSTRFGLHNPAVTCHHILRNLPLNAPLRGRIVTRDGV